MVPGACEGSSDEMVTWPYHVSTGKLELLNTTDASGVPGGVVWAMMLLTGAAAEVGKFRFAYIQYFAWLFEQLAESDCSAVKNQRRWVYTFSLGLVTPPSGLQSK